MNTIERRAFARGALCCSRLGEELANLGNDLVG